MQVHTVYMIFTNQAYFETCAYNTFLCKCMFNVSTIWRELFACLFSFSLSHENSDLVGKVDVVSDARNIKKLLKMPYRFVIISSLVTLSNKECAVRPHHNCPIIVEPYNMKMLCVLWGLYCKPVWKLSAHEVPNTMRLLMDLKIDGHTKMTSTVCWVMSLHCLYCSYIVCIYSYSSSHVSMAVHRVDQTLLIDEFSHTASASSSSNFDRLCKEGKLPNVSL